MATLEVPARSFCDDWIRGVRYSRNIQILDDATGQPEDLTLWPQLTFQVEGENGTRADALVAARYNDAIGGAAQGAIRLIILAEGLELDRDPSDEFGRVKVTLTATDSGSNERILLNGWISVEDSALA